MARDVAAIRLSTVERNELWDVADFAYAPDVEAFSHKPNPDDAQKVEDWLYLLRSLGFDRTADVGEEVLANDQFLRVLEVAKAKITEVLADHSITLSERIWKADEGTFLPPVVGDSEGQWIAAAFTIRGIMERTGA